MAETDLDKALRLADTADAITMKYYLSSDLRVTDKPDATPVTQADTETEQALAHIVHEEFGDKYVGEEQVRDKAVGRRWVVDPVDGTKNFMRGMPIWATLIALSDDSGPLVAAVSAPALGRRWWAAKGQGAWTRDVDGSTRRIHTTGVKDIANAFLLVSSPLGAWDRTPSSEAAVQKLLADAWRWRAPGDMINYMWVAEGAADACFEPYAKQWDIEAPALIVTEAGGTIWTNADANTPADAERLVLATNGPLEQPIRKALSL